jgi:excisionase family DNA binding protein
LAYLPREAAMASTLSITTIREMIRDGRLPVTRVGRRVLITAETLERLVTTGSAA